MDAEPERKTLKNCVPARYILAVLGSIGMAIAYGLKVNLSVALVSMLNHTALKGHQKKEIRIKKELDGPFIWTHDIQGLIISCYFWGYFVSQIPGARIAELLSAKWVMFFSVTINVVCTLLTPVMAELHYIALMVMRILEGIGGGVTFPAMHVLLSKWAPPKERSVMAALVYAGTSLGTVISMLMTGVLSAHAGWKSVFYVMGGLSAMWCLLWVVLVQDSPQQHMFISSQEKNMIITSLGGKAGEQLSKKKTSVPWRAVLTSAPFLAILVAHVCSNWGWYMMLVELPFYMNEVFHFNMTENALATALPFLSLWIFSMILSRTLDWLRSKNTITTSTARKIGTLCGSKLSPAGISLRWIQQEWAGSTGVVLPLNRRSDHGIQAALPVCDGASVVPAACLLALCYIGNNSGAAVAIMSVGITFVGGMFCGFLANHIDIAPNFAGTLIAVTNTVATVPGIVVPIFAGALRRDNQTIAEWRIIFFVTIALYVIEIIVYTIFGSGEEQSWNKANEQKDEREKVSLTDTKSQV